MDQNTNISQVRDSSSLALLAKKFDESYDEREIPLMAFSFSATLKEIESLFDPDCTHLPDGVRKPTRLSLINIASLLLFKVDLFVAELSESELNNEDIESIMTIVHDLSFALNALEATTLADQLASSFARGLYAISQDLIRMVESIPDLLKKIIKEQGNV
ncbi:MAG: hypothetical protein GAK29_00906 [Acinetobacter bereziniae]|uniref:Uncharacterized protein n=1 Tax=Acinetobacter bereziniae TaxID=106648 RepID=A0A833PHS1_ACIBZ|nr:MAG: hypothetical protein GAK29_00906 [Acinetobacter bereziniae]